MLASNALTTIERAKSYLGMEEKQDTVVNPEDGTISNPPLDTALNEKEDANLAMLINAASNLIERFCKRKFRLQDYMEALIGRDSVKLILPHYPIVALKSVEIMSYETTQSIDINSIKVMADNGILYRPAGGFPASVKTGTFMHPNYDNPLHNIFVEFSAGYVLPKDDTPETPRNLPYDIELACFKVIANMKRDQDINRGQGETYMKSESLGDWSASYEMEIKVDSASYREFLSPEVQTLLGGYIQGEFFV